MKMSIYKSIGKNYIANNIGLGINFLNKIVLVPFFISIWGTDKYADWILITSFSSFFTMFDMGLNTIITNEFIIRYQKKEFFLCTKLLVNAFLFVFSVGLFCIVIITVISCIHGIKNILYVSIFSEFETSFVFIILLSHVFIKMYSSIYHSSFMATSHLYIVMMAENIAKSMELIILFFGLLFKIDMILLIVLFVFPSLLCLIWKHCYSQKLFRVNFSIKLFDVSVLRPYIKPSFALMSMPVGFAVSNQGLLFIINILLGNNDVVLFTTMRTLVNFLRSMMGLLSNAISPHISIAYGNEDKKLLLKLYYRPLIITFFMSLSCAVFLFFFGKSIYLFWTNNKIVFNPFVFNRMLIVLFISTLSGVISTMLFATNNHVVFSISFLISQLIGIAGIYISLKYIFSLSVVPLVLIGIEFFILWLSTDQVHRLLHITWRMNGKNIIYEVSCLAFSVHNIIRGKLCKKIKK
jgi:O-antigen/teichoic acid export membrane protein